MLLLVLAASEPSGKSACGIATCIGLTDSLRVALAASAFSSLAVLEHHSLDTAACFMVSHFADQLCSGLLAANRLPMPMASAMASM